MTDTINNVASLGRDIANVCAQVKIETRRLEHALDCLMLKAQTDVQIYRESLPLLDKNFTAMHNRMDRLMDKAMDMLCEDVSEASLKRQEMAMSLIEMTNDSLNNLIAKLMPNH
ncbi:MAG: hypothetical protein K2K97_00455 [Muribaculaceae bacterium]|nr:hypothetical protein [Muribaculaceae bacterium]